MSQRNPLLPRILAMALIVLFAGAALGAAYRAWAAPRRGPAMAPAAQGAIPGVVSYQAYLTNAGGRPINGSTDVTFRLYNMPTGGTELWTEAHAGSGNAIPVSNGLFNVYLGSLTPIPPTVWANSTLYLGVQVGTDAEMSPREVIGAVPAAMTVPDGAITQAKLGADVMVVPPDGSVTTAKLADGAASSRKVHLTSESRRPASDPRPVALTSSYQDIAGTSATVTLDSEQTLLVTGVFDFEAQKSGTLTGALSVDGAELDATATLKGPDGTRATVSQVWLMNLGPGSHTLKLRAKSASGAGALLWNAGSSLTYVAFAQ
jgi:hypothetical protein